jgi:hypothetical protein
LARLETTTRAGRLVVIGARTEMLEAAADLVLCDHERGGAGVERVELAGTQAWFKRSLLRGRSRWRWAMRRVPRVREHDNLVWLLRTLFQVPVPLAAGKLVQRGLPLRQFLFTQDMPGVVPLDQLLCGGAHPARAIVLDELARETARMHALGFVHHDLYTRNVLVLPDQNARRVAFVDAWAGGPSPQLRSGAYDLACFFLRADRELTEGEAQRFLALYAAERAAQGRPIDAQRMLARAKRLRARLVRRLIARPHELRGEPVPGVEW